MCCISQQSSTGPSGALSLLQLKNFAKLFHTAYGIYLGPVWGIWLQLKEEGRRYNFGYSKQSDCILVPNAYQEDQVG
jgi:hypothetical protein